MPEPLASAALVLVAAAAFWGLFQLRVYFAVGGGYKAKVLCTGIFGSLRDLDPQRADQVFADSYWLLRPFAVRVDRTARTVTTSCLGFQRVAVHRDGLGATLLSGSAGATNLGPVLVARSPSPGTSAARGTGAVGRIVDAAFDEPDPRRLRRTYAVVVMQDGRVIAERYAPGIGAGTPLPGWSMTKSILSALVGILVERGTLALDARELLPAWRAPDPRAAIALEDLLRMRSGLRFSEVYANPWSDVLHMLYNCADTAAYAAARPLAAAPGTQWSYSSGTTNILSRIVRNAVGDGAYHAWPRQVLFDRIGMTSAVLEPDASGTFVCSSYGLATARDWARYGQLWLDGGRYNGQTVLPEWWIRFSTTPTPQSDGRYGAHWWLKLNPDIGGDTDDARAIAADAFFAVGHEGQTLTVVPSRRLVVVRLGAAIYIDAWNQARFIAELQEATA